MTKAKILKFYHFLVYSILEFSRVLFFRTAPFKWIEETRKLKIIQELNSMETSINWNNLGKANSIKDSLLELKEGKDIGWMGTKSLMPNSDDFHHWMHFAYLLTTIYNRDCSPKKFSVVRNGTY